MHYFIHLLEPDLQVKHTDIASEFPTWWTASRNTFHLFHTFSLFQIFHIYKKRQARGFRRGKKERKMGLIIVESGGDQRWPRQNWLGTFAPSGPQGDPMVILSCTEGRGKAAKTTYPSEVWCLGLKGPVIIRAQKQCGLMYSVTEWSVEFWDWGRRRRN